MNDTGVIDTFLATFATYIDSGFGLLGGEVQCLAATLIGIDITLAALFWAWAQHEDILARLVRKTLYVGFFAFLIGNFNKLAQVVFDSFSGLGLEAAGGAMSASDFIHPGKLAQAGIDAGTPILQAVDQMSGFPQFFQNFVMIIIMLIAWMVVIVAFFVLAVQLFVTLIEFKLTTLAGFVLVPFGLFGKTAFLAEKVLGNVIASGVKVLVLAVIVGIGSTLFGGFTAASPTDPTLEQVLALALAALALLGLGIFGPGIATGLVSGAPQLGAGAAVGTALTVGGLGMAGAMGIRAAAGGVAGLMAAASAGSSGRPGPIGGGEGGWRPPPTGGPSGGQTGGPSSGSPAGMPGGGSAARAASDGLAAGGGAAAAYDEAPPWAKRLQHGQAASHGAITAAHAVASGDRGGGSNSISLAEDRS